MFCISEKLYLLIKIFSKKFQEKTMQCNSYNAAGKVSKYEVFSGPYFPVFSRNTGKYRPYLDTFHAVLPRCVYAADWDHQFLPKLALHFHDELQLVGDAGWQKIRFSQIRARKSLISICSFNSMVISNFYTTAKVMAFRNKIFCR